MRNTNQVVRIAVILSISMIGFTAVLLSINPHRLSAAQKEPTNTISVTTTDDELNSDGDCSLREAVQAA
ncbi:MAG: CSLREA domain-containing protein, partial [Chloroflexota bacterium]